MVTDRHDIAEAEQAAAAAVRLMPDEAAALERLGLLQLQLGKPRAARDNLLRAFDIAPDSPAIRIHAARACAVCRDTRVEELLRPWRTWLPLDAQLQLELLNLQAQLGEAESALALLEDLVARVPTHLVARLLLASAYERVNRLDDAEALLQGIVAEDAVVTDKAHSEIAHQRARLLLRRGEPAASRALLEQTGPRNDADFAHRFALADACDQLGDVPAAMRALGMAHALQLGELRRSAPHLFEPGTGIFPRADVRTTASDYHAWQKLRAPNGSQSPVFVVGFPRSGTTLLEQMLDAHPRLQSMDERPFFEVLSHELEQKGIHVPRDLRKLGQDDCDDLRRRYYELVCSKITRGEDSWLVDKNPLNMLWLSMIHRLFPEAKFILVLRHPCDVVLSCYMQNFRGDLLAAASQSLEHLARAYVAVMESWAYHVEVFKPDVLVSRHEDLVVHPAAQVRRIASFLELDDADSLLDHAVHARAKGYIKTPSYAQVTEPINARSMGRWQRYREYLDPVLPILRPMLENWNYST